jgi:hypothetical protein
MHTTMQTIQVPPQHGTLFIVVLPGLHIIALPH